MLYHTSIFLASKTFHQEKQALDKLKVCKYLATPKILQDRGVKGQMIRDLLSQAERVAFNNALKFTEEVIEYLF